MNPQPRWFIFLLSLLLAGCAALQPATETPLPSPTPAPTPTPASANATEPAAGNLTLRIWLPPEFAPGSESAAGRILQARLEEFSSRRAGVTIETRIKPVEGPGGILDTLKTAKVAAPLALPDLVALPYAALQQAASDGLLHTYDGLTNVMDDPDWYDFARQLSHVQNSTLGIPFAGDALVMVYRPAVIETPPASWDETLTSGQTIAFAAGDPNGLFTLTLYQAATGLVTDAEGNPALDMLPLTDTLTFIYQGNRNGVFPFWLTQYETSQQAWEAYQEQQADMVTTWASLYLQATPTGSAIALLPTPHGVPITAGDGWVWALTSGDTQRQHLAAELAEFLTTADFLASWTRAAGYLPPRPAALKTGWENHPDNALLGKISASIFLTPPATGQTLGPLLSTATIDILKEQTDPATAAQTAIEGLIAP